LSEKCISLRNPWEKQPEVEWQLTMPPLPGRKSVPIDTQEYRDQVDEAFRHASHQWDAVYGISSDLYNITATAARFARQRDYANAAAIYEVVVLETLSHYLSYHDEDGALAPENPQFNYIVDMYGKWYHRYFYFCATYCVPGPNATVPSFEAKFARMEYAGNNRFHLALPAPSGIWQARVHAAKGAGSDPRV
jgi:hypothetical protein